MCSLINFFALCVVELHQNLPIIPINFINNNNLNNNNEAMNNNYKNNNKNRKKEHNVISIEKASEKMKEELINSTDLISSNRKTIDHKNV